MSCLLAFTSSACTLVIEFIAGRIMAPYIGVSLYTWTSIIGVVLAGMSGGNFFGGFVADRFASRRTLGLVFVAGSVASLGILVVTHSIVGVTFGLLFPAADRPSIAAIFFLPSFVLGMVSPLVVKLALADLHSGHTVGTIYAASTRWLYLRNLSYRLLLISWLGTRSIVWLVAAHSPATGLRLGGFRSTRRRVTLTAAGIGCRPVRSARRDPRPLSRPPVTSSPTTYCIKVLETSEKGTPARMLMLDHLIHSYVVPDDPTALDYGYEHAYASLTQAHATGRQQLDTLFIGGGGYSFPRYVEAVYPQDDCRCHRDRSGSDNSRTRTARFLRELPDPLVQRRCASVPDGMDRSQTLRHRLRRRIQRSLDSVSPDDGRVQ